MKEQRYVFIDMTGSCFETFQLIGGFNYTHEGEPFGERVYRDDVGAMLQASNNNEFSFSAGDMMVYKDDLIKAGFEWGVDFYVKKITMGEDRYQRWANERPSSAEEPTE